MKQVLWGLAFLWISFAAHAQYPNKPVRVVVPFPAGSSTDIVTRVLANSVSQSIGQQLVVDNKAGADGWETTGLQLTESRGVAYVLKRPR